MPPRQWEPLVAEFSDVMKLVHLAMRRDATDIASIANELFKEKRQAYEDGLTAQAANAGCAGRKGVMPNDKLTMAHDESNSEAAGIANTYNYDLAVAIRHIRTETPSANRHVYAKRLLEWEATRDEWKSQQIALWNQTKWTNIAFQDFLAHNPQLNNGYAILQPKRTVCKICQYWASRGKVPLAEASRIEFPAHINCPHYWETHYKGKVNCEELWMGADVKQWWEDIEAGKELGEKGGPGSGNYGHSGRPGLVGGSGGGEGISKVGDMVSKFEDLRSRGFLTEVDDASWKTMARDAAKTAEMYGEPSTNEGAVAHTKAENIWYGDNPLYGGWHPLAEGLQNAILASPLPINEVLYRGVYGRYVEDLLSIGVGEEFGISEFASTSRSMEIAKVFMRDVTKGALLIINAREGMPALYIHDLASEFLLPATAKFMVTDIKGNMMFVDYVGVGQ